MKFLALSVQGTPIPAPLEVQKIQIGLFGQNIFRVGITILFILSFVLALLFIILGGIQWITSGGDKEKVQKARGRLTYAIIGLVIILLSFFIVNLVGGFFQANLLGIYTCGGKNLGSCPPGKNCVIVQGSIDDSYACR